MDAELNKPFKLCFGIFKFFGMWQDGEQTLLYVILGYSFYVLCLGSETLGMLKFALDSETIVDFTDAFGLFITNLADIAKSMNLFWKIKLIKKSVETLESLLKLSEDKRFESRSLIKVQTKRCHKVFKMLLFSAIATCTAAILTPLIHHKLPYKVWIPFEDNEISFWTFSSVLIVNSYYVAISDMALDILPVIFMSFAIGISHELSQRFTEINEVSENVEKDEKQQVDELVQCIKIHQKLREFLQEIRDNFSTAILAQALMSSIILCISAFNLSTANDINSVLNYASFMIPMVLEIFLPCYFGNELTIASQDLSRSLFQSNWVEGSPKLRGLLKIFFENAKQDLKVTAFTIFDVNLATFGRILNSAYSLFAVLKRLSV